MDDYALADAAFSWPSFGGMTVKHLHPCRWKSDCRLIPKKMIQVAPVKSKTDLSVWVCLPGVGWALAHLLLTLMVFVQHDEGSWAFYFFVIPDFPIMLLLALVNGALSFKSTWLFLIIFGTIWWYLLGCLITRFFRSRQSKDATK